MKIVSKYEDRTRGHKSDAGNSAQPTHIFIRLDGASELQHQSVDHVAKLLDLVQVKLSDLSDPCREVIRLIISQNARYRTEIGWPLSNDDPKLTEVAAQCVDELRALSHEALVSTKCQRARLMFSALIRDIMHVWTLCSLRDRRCISCVILPPFDEWLHVDRWD